MNQIMQSIGPRGIRMPDEGSGRVARRVAIVTPVLDDWHAFRHLLSQIGEHAASSVDWIEIVAVDDGSANRFDLDLAAAPPIPGIDLVRVVRLALNLGHQRAIAVGLVTLASRGDLDAVIVMDCDGEDRPEEIPLLLRASHACPDHVILAHRSKRSESALFRVGYSAYKGFFRLLTGRSISFGNFSVLPLSAVRRLAHMPELWNNLPAAIMRSRLRYATVHTIRGTRFAGRSSMSFPSLVIHGLSAMSVYTDLIFVRVLLGAGAVSLVSFLAICLVVAVRLGTSLAVPGWATTIFGDLVIILFQAMLMIVATSLMILAGRSARPIVPITDATIYIESVVEIPGRQEQPAYGAAAE